jgi:RNA polymerase sigma-70 factor (ECF subfamily)
MPDLPETRASLIRRLPDAADARAWDEFVGLYGPVVYGMARRSGLQPADADDVVQQVLAAVARSVESWLERRDRGPFRAWLVRIARNTAINTLTRRGTRAVGANGDQASERLLHQAAARSDDLASEFDLELRRAIFQRAADCVRNEVTQRTWQAFWLSTVEQQPIAAVAEQLKMSPGSVYIARSRVMARLREAVGRMMEEG